MEVNALEHGFLTVAEVDVLQSQANGVTIPEGVFQRRVTGLLLQLQQAVDSPQRRIGGEPGVLHIQHFLYRREHKPQVAKDGEHHADAQVAEQDRHHRRRAEGVDTKLEQRKAGAGGGVAAPFKLYGVVANRAGAADQLAQVVLFPVGRPELVDRVQGFRQVALKILVGAILLAFEFLDPFANEHGGEDHQRIEQQDQQPKLPVNPHQHDGGSGDGQARHQETADGGTQELIDGVQVGDEMTGDAARATGFVLRHGHPLQPAQQSGTDTEHHILGNLGELTGLKHVEGERQRP